MNKEIQWSFGIENKIDEQLVRSIEKLWNIRFPQQFVDIVLKHNQGSPQLRKLDGDWKFAKLNIPEWRGEYTDISFLNFLDDEMFKKSSIIITYETYKDSLPEPDKIFPFADDAGGNMFFFDYRQNENEPSIVFLDHEEAFTAEELTPEELEIKPAKEWLDENLLRVCNSFSELLEALYILPDEEF